MHRYYIYNKHFVNKFTTTQSLYQKSFINKYIVKINNNKMHVFDSITNKLLVHKKKQVNYNLTLNLTK